MSDEEIKSFSPSYIVDETLQNKHKQCYIDLKNKYHYLLINIY
jgi:hypothetical protein